MTKKASCLTFAAIFLWAAGTPVPARGKDRGEETIPCQDILDEATRLYERGSWDAALDEVDKCLPQDERRKIKKRHRLRAWELRAKIHIERDEMDQARAAVESLLRYDADFEGQEPPRLVRLVREVKRERPPSVRSVSKSAEDLREAPATVVVIDSGQIDRRGYMNLEELIHDLPGFDVSHNNGLTYSSLYQRGYRSDLTIRTLVLVDGVEENDLWGQIAYLSRQYPISNVDRVEVVYGPASTMYGANAFIGVVNVITKDPSAYLAGTDAGESDEDDVVSFGGEVHVSGGSFGTGYLEANLAGTAGELTWSLTGRIFNSDEPDLSGFDEWDYDPNDVFNFPLSHYQGRMGIGAGGVDDFLKFLGDEGLTNCSGQDGCDYSVTSAGVVLTDAGAERARALDHQALLSRLPDASSGREAQPLGFSDTSDDWLVSGKLQLQKMTVAFESWRRDEGGAPFYTDLSAAGADNGFNWVPEQTWLSVSYASDLTDSLSFSFFSRYKLHKINGESLLHFLNSYTRNLDLKSLVSGFESSWSPIYWTLSSNQLRSEISLLYDPSPRFDLVAGVELRDSSVQGNYVLSGEPDPSLTGTVDPLFGDNQFDTRDLGFYAQASFRPVDKLKIIAGGRIDNNKVRDSLGYGTVFNPRLGVVYTRKRIVWKAIYAQAFQDPSNFQKYVTVPGLRDEPSPDLKPEQVENVELSAGWKSKDENLAVELAAYQADYSNVVQFRRVDCGDPAVCDTTLTFDGIGALRIRGLQATASWQRGEKLHLSGNLTYTDPVNTDPRDTDGDRLEGVDELRVGDIASHQVNLAVNYRLSDNVNLNVRANYVGEKDTGKDTTISTNPLDRVDSYTVAHATLTWEPKKDFLRETKLQLIVKNLLDADFYHPGIREADGILYAPQVPQPGRAVFLRLSVGF